RAFKAFKAAAGLRHILARPVRDSARAARPRAPCAQIRFSITSSGSGPARCVISAGETEDACAVASAAMSLVGDATCFAAIATAATVRITAILMSFDIGSLLLVGDPYDRTRRLYGASCFLKAVAGIRRISAADSRSAAARRS